VRFIYNLYMSFNRRRQDVKDEVMNKLRNRDRMAMMMMRWKYFDTLGNVSDPISLKRGII
jgi:hypothetical protein